MKTSIAVIADRSRTGSNGKLDVLGAYNFRTAPSFPARMDVTLVLRFDVEPADYGVPQRMVIHVLDEDDAELVNLSGSPITFQPTEPPGLPLAFDQTVPISIAFPREGVWTFDVRMNERSMARVSLLVRKG